jgi:dynein heavy chain 1, cytosolic
MIVGSSGSGKTVSWKLLFKALQKLDGLESHYHVIDPKSISKDNLYGWIDHTTREWTDGVFTKILREIANDVRGSIDRRHWIVFDGDVDPEWVENLNSVLDDNKILTLPNGMLNLQLGERLAFPSNARILFEVESLEMATPATGNILRNVSFQVWNGVVFG